MAEPLIEIRTASLVVARPIHVIANGKKLNWQEARMDLKITETQQMMMDGATSFLRKAAPPTKIARWFKENTTFLPDLYKSAAELGWLGMMIPEEYGGTDVSLTDCAVLYEALGHGPLPGPLFSSGVLAALVIRLGGSEAQKQELLPAIATGEAIVVLAMNDQGAFWGPDAVETRMKRDQGSVVLHGTKRFVLDAEGATHFICCARDETGQLALVLVNRGSSGLSVNPCSGFIASTSEVIFDHVKVPAENIIGEPGGGWTLLDNASQKALPVLCAYKVGACQEIFDFTNEYTRQRVVFGQPIGRFQRVQDHCVDISTHLDSARWITYESLWRLETDQPNAGAGVHEAKAVASEAYYEACNLSHKVHAGPGTDYDHPLMAHSALAHTLYQYLGTPIFHKRKMIDALYPRARQQTAARPAM